MSRRSPKQAREVIREADKRLKQLRKRLADVTPKQFDAEIAAIQAQLESALEKSPLALAVIECELTANPQDCACRQLLATLVTLAVRRTS